MERWSRTIALKLKQIKKRKNQLKHIRIHSEDWKVSLSQQHGLSLYCQHHSTFTDSFSTVGQFLLWFYCFTRAQFIFYDGVCLGPQQQELQVFTLQSLELLQKNTALQCDLCDSWVHIACNNLNVYTYRKLQKDKSPWYCICCFRKELPYGSTNDTQLKKLLHGEVVVSPNPKIISSIIKQSEYLDKELLSKANNKLYTLDEFNNAGKNQ